MRGWAEHFQKHQVVKVSPGDSSHSLYRALSHPLSHSLSHPCLAPCLTPSCPLTLSHQIPVSSSSRSLSHSLSHPLSHSLSRPCLTPCFTPYLDGERDTRPKIWDKNSQSITKVTLASHQKLLLTKSKLGIRQPTFLANGPELITLTLIGPCCFRNFYSYTP